MSVPDAAGGTRWTEVAVGIPIRADGAVLLAQRPPGKPYAGWWEFPGGKVEPGESVGQALARELHEELGIDVDEQSPWLVRHHVYPHASVRLHFRRVTGWRGEPRGREGQRFAWCPPGRIDTAPLLPAAIPLLGWLRLPPVYAITHAWPSGGGPTARPAEPSLLEAGGSRAADPEAAFLARLEAALSDGLRLVQLREPDMPAERFERLFYAVRGACRAAGASLLVSSAHPTSFWRATDGVHLRSTELMALDGRPAGARLVGASCHDAGELAQAARIGCDFAVLGPVRPTASHAGAPGMGWDRFEALVARAELPVYALGGLHAGDIASARQRGGHGVAMIRGAWGKRGS